MDECYASVMKGPTGMPNQLQLSYESGAEQRKRTAAWQGQHTREEENLSPRHIENTATVCLSTFGFFLFLNCYFFLFPSEDIEFICYNFINWLSFNQHFTTESLQFKKGQNVKK